MDPYKRDNTWVIRWRDATGHWHQKRTKCTTKDQARKLLDEIEKGVERLKLGMDPAAGTAPKMTFAELVTWWWDEYGSRLRSGTILGTINKHLVPELGTLLLTEVTPPRVEGLLVGKEKVLSPKTINTLRGFLLRMFNLAIRRGLWNGINPATRVERRKVPKRLPEYLRFEEVPRVLDALPPQLRPLFATAVYTGMRQGELLGLRKSDVDLEGGTIMVARSYDHETTKGGHADMLPLADELRPFLEEALKASPSQFVFPAGDGSMQTKETALDKRLRAAMGRAGLVTGFIHRCRRCKKEVLAATAEAGRCAGPHPTLIGQTCGMALWPKAVPRHVRFHDLRHTTATLLLKNGVPLATVQRILRHTDPRLTSEVYGHLDVEDMRKAVNGLRFGYKASPGPKSGEPVPSRLFLPQGRLLNMKQVAKTLGVCRATAYRMIEEKILPHLRVSNSIRVSEEVLKEFIRQKKS
jgi:excisionase family DNA binding protein